MVCWLSLIQAPLQSFLRPAMWIPGIKSLHSHAEIWRSGADIDAVLKTISECIEEIQEKGQKKEQFVLDTFDANEGFVRIFAFTWAHWLDVMEFKIRDQNIQAVSFSSGFLPLSFPLASILNVVLCWIPFYDNKFNYDRLALVRESLPLPVSAQDV